MSFAILLDHQLPSRNEIVQRERECVLKTDRIAVERRAHRKARETRVGSCGAVEVRTGEVEDWVDGIYRGEDPSVIFVEGHVPADSIKADGESALQRLNDTLSAVGQRGFTSASHEEGERDVKEQGD